MRIITLFDILFTQFFRGLVTAFQVAKGFWYIIQLPQPCISIFGSSVMEKDSADITNAYIFAKKLADKGYGIITGGGPGIMNAANCGAYDCKSRKHKFNSIGITIKGIDESFKNECSPTVQTSYFWVRKLLLTDYSKAYLFFPGGIGTGDELFDILNSFKHGLMKKKPIVLFNSTYWKPLVEWYMIAKDKEYVKKEAEYFFVVTDDIDEAIDYVSGKKKL